MRTFRERKQTKLITFDLVRCLMQVTSLQVSDDMKIAGTPKRFCVEERPLPDVQTIVALERVRLVVKNLLWIPTAVTTS